MKEKLEGAGICALAVLLMVIGGIFFGPGVIAAGLVAAAIERGTNRRYCPCIYDSGPSVFAFVGFLVLWLPWLVFLLHTLAELLCSWWYA